MRKRTLIAMVLLLLLFIAVAEPGKTRAASTSVGKVKISSVKLNDAKFPIIKWKAVEGATGYQVYRKTNQDTKWKEIADTKKTSITDNKLEAQGDSEVLYKVRAYSKNSDNGKTIKGKFSKVKCITAPYKSLVLEYGSQKVKITSKIMTTGVYAHYYNDEYAHYYDRFFSKETKFTNDKLYAGKKIEAVAFANESLYDELFWNDFHEKHPEYGKYEWNWVIDKYIEENGSSVVYTDEEGHEVRIIHAMEDNAWNGHLYGETFLGYYGDDVYIDITRYSDGYSVDYQLGSDGRKLSKILRGYGSEVEEIDFGMEGVYAFVTKYEAYLYIDTKLLDEYDNDYLRICCTIDFNNDNWDYRHYTEYSIDDYRDLLKKIKDNILPTIVEYYE